MQYSSDAAAARDAQQLLQAAHRQAQRKEAEVLAAADEGAGSAPHQRNSSILTAPRMQRFGLQALLYARKHEFALVSMLRLLLQPTRLRGGALACRPRPPSCNWMRQPSQAAGCLTLEPSLPGSRHTSTRKCCSRLQCLHMPTSQQLRTTCRRLATKRWGCLAYVRDARQAPAHHLGLTSFVGAHCVQGTHMQQGAHSCISATTQSNIQNLQLCAGVVAGQGGHHYRTKHCSKVSKAQTAAAAAAGVC